MAAALITLRLVAQTDYLERIERLGGKLRSGLHERAAVSGFCLRQTGPVQMRAMIEPSQKLQAFFAPKVSPAVST